MSVVLFDDGGGKLGPVCDLRASFELRSGAVTTAERLSGQIGQRMSAVWVRNELAELVRERSPVPVNAMAEGDENSRNGGGGRGVLAINGRWTRVNLPLPERLNTAHVDEHGDVIAARLDRRLATASLTELVSGRGAEPGGDLTVENAAGAKLLRRPWQLLERAGENLEYDLERMDHLEPLQDVPGVTVVGEGGVFVSRAATVHPQVVFDTSAGPVAVDEGAEVRSMSVVVGPGYIGRGSIVTNHGHIRARSIIGPMCKVGGEVNSCLFHGHANKAHSGYLGNSYVGEWVNLGADTVTSNLKNTYSQVRMQVEPTGPVEPTDMTHLGSIIGDHVKTAIGTRLLTGSCLHTGAMVATSRFPPKCVDRFAFLTDDAQQRYELAKFIEVAQAVMSRRGGRVTAALRTRLEQLHATAAMA